MKKIYSIAIAAMAFLAGTAQAQVPRMILAEEFTQASCGPCAAQNPNFNTLLAANTSKVIGLKYQTNWPGVDPMNTQTQSWVGPRVTYYAVSGVPHACMDGTAQTGASYTGAPANWTQAKIDTRFAVTSPFSVSVSHTFDASYSNVTVTIDVTCSQATTATLALQTAIVEKEISFCQAPGTNGETEFYGVCRKMLPDANGTILAGSWTAGQTQQFVFTSAVPSYIYDLKQLAVVAFVQNNTSKEVLQTAISEPLPIALDASLKNCSAATALLTCSNSYSPIVTVYNTGSSTINTLDLSYTITGSSAQTFTYSTPIAAGANAQVNIPALTIASSPSTFSCSVVSVNGGTDYVTGNNTYSLTLNLVPSTIYPAPIVQGFVAVTFPPTDWTRINGGGTPTWSRSTVGASAANGSTKMDFYNSAAGDVEFLYTPKVDLSVISNPSLTFTIAKASYTGYSDRLDVLASTDCGVTWTNIYTKSDPTLTTAGALASAFTPTSGNSAQWRVETVSLASLAASNSVMFAFKAISGYGNNLYIDDINISSPTGIVELNGTSVNVYPSITKGELAIQLPNSITGDITISVLDASGKLIQTTTDKSNSSEVHLDLSNYSNGIYMVQIISGNQSIMKKVILEK